MTATQSKQVASARKIGVRDMAERLASLLIVPPQNVVQLSVLPKPVQFQTRNSAWEHKATRN